MKLSLLSATVACATLALGAFTQVNTVHAAEVLGESKNTATEVNLVDSPDPAVLKFINAPEFYHFSTKLQYNGAYAIEGGSVTTSKFITVFNDKSQQSWSVKAAIKDTSLKTDGNKTATVTAFKINGQDLMGEKSDPIIYKSADKKNAENNTGILSKEVFPKGLGVMFNNEKHDLIVGDVLKGTVHYQLYDTPDAK